jgi:hypothetical protein
MGYLNDLGIKSSEPEIAHHFANPNETIYFDDSLKPNIYQNFVKFYSTRRKKLNEREMIREVFGGYDLHNTGMVGSSKIETIINEMYGVGQDPEVIKRRQELIKRFTNISSEESSLIERLLVCHSNLNDALYRASDRDERYSHFPEMIHPFMEIAYSLFELDRRYEGDSLMNSFSQRIKGFFEENPAVKQAYLFDWRSGRGLVDRAKVSLSKLSLKGTSAFNLGLFSDNSMNYTAFKGLGNNIQRFEGESDSFIHTLATFYYMARAFNNAKAKGQPTCFPNINDRGVFELTNAMPIATKLDGNCPVNIDFRYNRQENKFLLSGPHSGGKTELLKNLGVYHALALSGFFVPADSANVPLTKRIITSFKKNNQANKGSLESEINETSRTISSLGQGDLVLWDEFVDTAKPELAAYLEVPLLEGFSASPATVGLVSHRASSLERDLGFRFMYPELREVEVPKTDAAAYINSEILTVDPEVLKQGKNVKVLIPTHRFIEGRPDPKLTRDHAFQMWALMKGELGANSYGYWPGDF